MPARPILWHWLLRAASLHHPPPFLKSHLEPASCFTIGLQRGCRGYEAVLKFGATNVEIPDASRQAPVYVKRGADPGAAVTGLPEAEHADGAAVRGSALQSSAYRFGFTVVPRTRFTT